MAILPTITNLEGFANFIKEAKPVDSIWGLFRAPRFSIQNIEYNSSQLVEKFESLIPEQPTLSTKTLAQKVFTNLTKLTGSPLNELRKKLLYTAEEVQAETLPEVKNLYAVMLPTLFKEDPGSVAKLIHSSGEAKAAAIALRSGVLSPEGVGISLFERADRIYNWEKRTGLNFDKRFTTKQPEASYSSIFEPLLTDWIKTGGTAKNRANREKAAPLIREAYNGGQPHGDVELDLRGLPIIPDIVGVIPNLKRLYLDRGAMLQNPDAFQNAYHRNVVLDLIKANPFYIQYIRRELKVPRFIVEALYHNGAVLQYLSDKVRTNKTLLLHSVEYASGLIAHIPEPLRCEKAFMLSLVKAMAFGKEQWKTILGADVGEEPPLTEEILNFLTSNDPDHPGKKRVETGIFYLRPAKVNLSTFIELVKGKFGDSVFYYISPQVIAEHGTAQPERAEWIWMATDVIPGSKDKTYSEHQRLIGERPGLEVPDLLSLVVGSVTRYAKRGEHLFSDVPGTFTSCSNAVDGLQAVVGLTSDGLIIQKSRNDHYHDLGVAGMRKAH